MVHRACGLLAPALALAAGAPALVLIACAAAPLARMAAPAPAPPTETLVAEAGAVDFAAARHRSPSSVAALPAGPSLSSALLGFVLISDGQRVLGELAGDRAGDLRGIQTALADLIGLEPHLAQVIDLRRPLVVALLEPSQQTGGSPLVALVPVGSRAAVERALDDAGLRVAARSFGVSVERDGARLCIAFAGHYAVLASRPELLAGTVAALAPILERAREAPLVAHLDLENAHAAFGPLFDVALRRLGASGADPQAAFALRGVELITRYAPSVAAAELLADFDSGGLTVTARIDGKADGAWAGYVQKQHPGPAWGLEFLPRDAVLVYTTNLSEVGSALDIEASVNYLADATPRRPPAPAEVRRWKDALEQAASSTGGELAYAVWPGRSGGVGLGGAYRVIDEKLARTDVRRAYEQLADRLGGLMMRALSLDPDRFSSQVHVRHRATRVGGAEADLLEVTVTWPPSAQGERQLFESLFGPKLVLAIAFVGPQALFAIGRDYQARLSTMIGVARGVGVASVGDDPEYAEAVGFRDRGRVSMSFLDTQRMARFLVGLFEQTGTLDLSELREIEPALRAVGRGVIVSTTNASGARYELTTHVPRTAVSSVLELGGALWWMALSPLVNPPPPPPLPVPPSHVTPGLQTSIQNTL